MLSSLMGGNGQMHLKVHIIIKAKGSQRAETVVHVLAFLCAIYMYRFWATLNGINWSLWFKKTSRARAIMPSHHHRIGPHQVAALP